MIQQTFFSDCSNPLSVAVIGATGGIGSALMQLLAQQKSVTSIHAFSRNQGNSKANNTALTPINSEKKRDDKVQEYFMDILSEQSIIEAIETASAPSYDLIIVATGILHSSSTAPEKKLRDINYDTLEMIFKINTFAPALLAKHFVPRLTKNNKSVFACLSARVGSISDNRLGGWYSYRASKAALNMMIKTISIETQRTNKNACIIGLHPGTVDTALSKPYQSGVKKDKLFSPKQSAHYLLTVIDDILPEDSGKIFAWDGQEVPA